MTLTESVATALTEAERFLGGLPLFAGLPGEELARFGPMLMPFEAPAGTTLFRAGDRASSMYVVQHGLLEVSRHLPGERDLRLATVGARELIGELAVINGGQRTATVRALEDTTGWVLDGRVFELLRNDLRPDAIELTRRLGALAVTRLRHSHESMAARLDGNAGETPAPGGRLGGVGEVDPERGELDYLARILFFQDFEPAELGAVVAGLRRLAAPRGAVLRDDGEADDALLIVLRGAVEVTIRGGGQAARVLLAGPGRAAGHLGVLDDGPSLGVCRTRERCVLLEVPRARIAELTSGATPEARRFAQALLRDVVGALQQAERPLARMAAHG